MHIWNSNYTRKYQRFNYIPAHITIVVDRIMKKMHVNKVVAWSHEEQQTLGLEATKQTKCTTP